MKLSSFGLTLVIFLMSTPSLPNGKWEPKKISADSQSHDVFMAAGALLHQDSSIFFLTFLPTAWLFPPLDLGVEEVI